MVGRPAEKAGPDLLLGWCAFRFKALPRNLLQRPVQGGILEEGLAMSDEQPSTVVLIALDKWNDQNGFFKAGLEMDAGDDICLDSSAKIQTPGTGGGLGVYIELKL